MNKKIFTLTAIFLLFGVLFSSFTHATSSSFSTFDVSIDRVRVNGKVVAESRTNVISDADVFSVLVDLTAVAALENAHVEAILRGRQTGSVVSDSVTEVNIAKDQSTTIALTLFLIEDLKREDSFDLTIRVEDARGRSEQMSFGIRTGDTITRGALDVSLDRVRVNGMVVSSSRTNFIEESDAFDVLVEFTTLEDLDDAHIEAIVRDLRSGTVVSDATDNFDLEDSLSSSKLLRLELIDDLKDSNSFELTVKIIDVEGQSLQKTYGLRMEDGLLFDGVERDLDVSIDRVKVNDKVVAQSRTNFIDESNDFDVLVEFTALEDLDDAHVEAILKDLQSGFVVTDATANFDLESDLSSSKLLRLELLDQLKQSTSFELTVKIVDSEGNSVQQLYGLRMQDGEAFGGVLDISIDSVEVENDVIVENENNFLIIGKGKNDLDVEIRLTSLETIEDAHIDAILSFENGDVVADATATFNINEDESILKKLELPLIGEFEQNSFRLKIKLVDAEGNIEERVYGLKISKQEFPFVISSISLNPESNLQAGKNLVARLRLKNSGVVPLEGVNAKVSIPELGVSATKFVDQIRNSGRFSEIREDFVLKILDSVPTGTYTVRSEVASQLGGNVEVKEVPIFIVGKNEQTKLVLNDKLVINVPILEQSLFNDGSEVIYPTTFTNEGPDARTYVLLLDGSNWANLRLSEPNAFVLEPKKSQTINVYASTKTDAKGEHTFLVTVKSKDAVLKQIEFKGDVIVAKGLGTKLKDLLKIILIGTVLLIIAMGLFFGIKRLMQGKDFSEEIPDEELGEAYY